MACQRAFISEAEQMHTVRHAHLVQLYGVCLSGSKVREEACHVMEAKLATASRQRSVSGCQHVAPAPHPAA